MHTMNVLPKLSLISTVVVASLFLSGCGEDDKTDSPVVLKTAFNQSEKNPQYKALEDFSQKLEAATGGKYKLEIHPNELLGDQRAALELVQSGAIQLAVVANPLVENYNKNFSVLAMPYIYNDSEHQRKVFTGDMLDGLFSSTKGNGFEVLTAYTAGARSMYVKGTPIKTPEDMKGRKIRVMQSDTMVKMLSCMGGTGVPMGQGEVYSAIQQGVLDGAENNEITYADLKQYEVAPHFSYTRHVMVADLLIVNEAFLSKMSPEDQATFRKLAKESTVTEFNLFNQALDTARQSAISQGATFTEVDIKPFQERCKPLQESMLTTPEQKDIYNKIRALAN
ncbi:MULTISPECIES: TRAP transporter substrate-binding protein [Proteus]|uniref:TRAP transporter substrate-binding protein n=1 Tax=Proteus TaxID=583 RepID=UPI000D699572|nr:MULTISPECIES: TRAP transporter substrate-binding protein [Proteus]MBG5950611.1 TRAP transporter substrate-binding protein [Proteus terrae]MCE9838264.1 TRAP transporter substrate-binding protein [Proteus terrae]NBN70286.1 DctP family TRAP transporter solute-binding subunit [Proteus sp. G2618]